MRKRNAPLPPRTSRFTPLLDKLEIFRQQHPIAAGLLVLFTVAIVGLILKWFIFGAGYLKGSLRRKSSNTDKALAEPPPQAVNFEQALEQVPITLGADALLVYQAHNFSLEEDAAKTRDLIMRWADTADQARRCNNFNVITSAGFNIKITVRSEQTPHYALSYNSETNTFGICAELFHSEIRPLENSILTSDNFNSLYNHESEHMRVSLVNSKHKLTFFSAASSKHRTLPVFCDPELPGVLTKSFRSCKEFASIANKVDTRLLRIQKLLRANPGKLSEENQQYLAQLRAALSNYSPLVRLEPMDTPASPRLIPTDHNTASGVLYKFSNGNTVTVRDPENETQPRLARFFEKSSSSSQVFAHSTVQHPDVLHTAIIDFQEELALYNPNKKDILYQNPTMANFAYWAEWGAILHQWPEPFLRLIAPEFIAALNEHARDEYESPQCRL